MDPDFVRLLGQLDSLKRETVAKAQRKALTRVGRIVCDAIVAVTPEQAGVPEGLLEVGELRAHIKASVRVAKDESLAIGGIDRVIVGPNTSVTKSVAGWVEYGHAGPKDGSPRTPPHPFIRPAFDAVETEAVEAYAETLTAEIEKAVRV